MGYIQSGKDAGATVHLGGERFGESGYFIKPTIFTNTRPDMKIVREEIFGPVAVVSKFENDDEAIRLANDSEYGLAAAIFTKNIDRAMRAAQSIRAGSFWVCHPVFRNREPTNPYFSSDQLRKPRPPQSAFRWLQVVGHWSRPW